MKDYWYVSENKQIHGFKCIRLKILKPSPLDPHHQELTLAGKYGEIWEYSSDLCYALITSPKIAARLGKRGYPGDEFLFKFDKKELKTWIKLLKISVKRPSTQLEWVIK